MTTPADPDAWQRNYEAKLAAVEERTDRMSSELEQIQVTERSRDGQISVTVNSQGALVGLELGDALARRNGNIVSAEVLQLVRAAQGRIREQVERTMQPFIGGTAAMDYVMGKVAVADPPETDAFRRPDPPRERRDGDDFPDGPIMG